MLISFVASNRKCVIKFSFIHRLDSNQDTGYIVIFVSLTSDESNITHKKWSHFIQLLSGNDQTVKPLSSNQVPTR